jgi:hypothetical protein
MIQSLRANLAKGSLTNRCCFHCQKIRLLELVFRLDLSGSLFLRKRCKPPLQAVLSQMSLHRKRSFPGQINRCLRLVFWQTILHAAAKYPLARFVTSGGRRNTHLSPPMTCPVISTQDRYSFYLIRLNVCDVFKRLRLPISTFIVCHIWRRMSIF